MKIIEYLFCANALRHSSASKSKVPRLAHDRHDRLEIGRRRPLSLKQIHQIKSSRSSIKIPHFHGVLYLFFLFFFLLFFPLIFRLQSRRCCMPGTLRASNIGRSNGLIVAFFLLVCSLGREACRVSMSLVTVHTMCVHRCTIIRCTIDRFLLTPFLFFFLSFFLSCRACVRSTIFTYLHS